MKFPNLNCRVEILSTIKDFMCKELVEYNNHNIHYDFSVNSFLTLQILDIDRKILEFTKNDNKN